MNGVRQQLARSFTARNLAIAAGVIALLVMLAYSLRTLDRAPPLYGDEAWIGSLAWSFVNGHGFQPSFALGAGVYEGGIDHWNPRLGSAPFVVAELIAGTSFWAYRFAAFVIALVALALFAWTLRRAFDAVMAVWGTLLLTVSWGFYEASHYVRWDSLAFLVACGILALLLRGPVTARTALAVGLLVGLSADVEFSIMAVTPGVVALILFAGDRPLRRLGTFGAGLAAGGAYYVVAHGVPFGERAQSQFEALYGNTYGVPMIEVVRDLSLAPIWRETERYEFMTASWASTATRLTAVTLAVCVLAALPLVAVAIRDLRLRPRRYPVLAVPGVMLLSHVLGVALIQGNKTPMYAWFGLPYGIAALLACARWVREHASAGTASRLVTAATVVVLGGLVLLAGRALVSDVRSVTKDPALEREFAALAAAAQPGETVLGEWLYWWGFRDEDFRYNSLLWIERWRDGASLDESFERLCPDLVLYDDVWDARYDQTETFGQRFPSLAPTDAAEREELRTLLASHYRVRQEATIGGREISLWERRPGACEGSLSN